MKLIIRTSTGDRDGFCDVRLVASADWSVQELLAEVRGRMPLPLQNLLKSTERAGSTIFLTKQPKGPEILEISALLKDCGIEEGCELWLKAGRLPPNQKN